MHIDLSCLATVFENVEFFLVCLYPPSPAVFEAGAHPNLDSAAGDGFWYVTSRATQSGQGLVSDTSTAKVLLRGYDADLGVHSYSAAADREKIADPAKLENGVFAYIRMGHAGAAALVKSDPLGVAPFYYRTLPQGGYLFASHPSLLCLEQESINTMGWMSMLQNGFFHSDQSFYKEIHRVPAGIELIILPGNMQARAWFDPASLPEGKQKIDDSAFQAVEDAYAESMEKLLALSESRILPFSSGYDSRRFFATMMEKKAGFKAVTCQVFHRRKGRYYDIDSFFAPKIAAQFGVDCEIVPAPPLHEYAADSRRRLSLIGTETFAHDWAVPFMAWMEKQPMSIVFDGLAGDTLGNSGYEFKGLHESAAGDLDILMSETVNDTFFKELSALFPTAAQFKNQYRSYLARYPRNLNGAELAFLQGHTRRCISPWITMMHPPGQVIVFPYCDLRFVRATLRYDPAEKYKWFLQKECLKRFYPAYFDFPGSRNMPADMVPVSQEQSDSMDSQTYGFFYDDKSTVFAALKYLNLQNKALLLLSVLFRPLRHRRSWLFIPLLFLVKTHQMRRIFVK